jgi:chromosome segregation ATPase
MKKIRNNTESQLRRTNGALQKISKTVFMGANEVKRLKAEIKSLNKVIKKQEKKYLKLYKTYELWHQKNIAKQTINNSKVQL